MVIQVKKSKIIFEEKVKERTKELEDLKASLLNILEDAEAARKRAEEEKNKTISIIKNFSDGLIVLDEQNKISLINSQAEKFFEIKEGEILRTSFSDFSKSPFLFSLADIFKGELKEIFRKEISLRENLILEVSAVQIKGDSGPAGFLIISHDISREKTVERMKSEFVSISAHQLRTPLAAIKWTLTMLLDGDAGPLGQKQKEMLEKTQISNERMIRLVNDLLDVSRIEEGRNAYKFTLEDIEPIVEILFKSYKGEAERRQIHYEFKRPFSKMPKILIDSEKIKLAVQNLIENAIRYCRAGDKVTVALKYDKKEIEVAVSDTGIGVPQEQQKRIFTKFFRSENALRLETEGSGLGLFISKNIVESHKGRIWFESAENKGSTFHIAIPIQKEFEEFLKEF
jgi:PAS domain S-box-containing protein